MCVDTEIHLLTVQNDNIVKQSFSLSHSNRSFTHIKITGSILKHNLDSASSKLGLTADKRTEQDTLNKHASKIPSDTKVKSSVRSKAPLC